MPVQFSFRTVHTPSIFSQGSQRFTAPTAQVPSHVPVMVPVAQDFKGDSVVVTPQDLPKLGLTNPKVQRPTGVEELSTVAADVPVDAVVEEASAAGPLSAADESFVLTAQPKAAEPIETVVEPVNNNAQPEIVAVEPVPVEETMAVMEPVEMIQEPVEVVQPVDPIRAIVEPIVNPAPVSPFETETYRAYNDFINTWLRLASVNLNRPDILSLVNTPQPQVNIQPQQNFVPAEVIQPVETPVETITEDMFVADPTTETILVEEATAIAVEPQVVTEESIVPESVTEVSEPAPVMQQAETVIAVSEPIVAVSEPVVEVSVPVAQEPTPVIAQPTPVQKSFHSAPQSINAIQPSIFGAVPRVTSRGRHSGFRYSFQHVPQRGTFFFNSIAG